MKKQALTTYLVSAMYDYSKCYRVAVKIEAPTPERALEIVKGREADDVNPHTGSGTSCFWEHATEFGDGDSGPAYYDVCDPERPYRPPLLIEGYVDTGCTAELLTALRGLLVLAETFDPMREDGEEEVSEIVAARAALAKAEGR